MKRAWVPLFSLLVGLSATVMATWLVAQTSAVKARAEFNDAIQASAETIRDNIASYIALLRGCSGLFAVQRQVTTGEFRAFVNRLRIAEEYPGARGIGFAQRTRPDELEALVLRMRAQGLPEFRIWPEGDRAEYFPIVFLEPADRRNYVALGYDMFSEPVRRAAMEKARDEAGPAASGKVTLVQEIEGVRQSGFLIYVPVYREGDIPPTQAERRSALIGFAYSPFRAGDLFGETISPAAQAVFRYRVYDGASENEAGLLHASEGSTQNNRARFTRSIRIDVAGRPWTLRFESQPAFEARAHGGSLTLVIFLSGVVVSLLLFYFTNAEARARHAAEQSAARLKRSREALRESEERSRLIVESARDYGIMSLDPAGTIVSWNTGAQALYGYAPSEAIGRNFNILFTPEDRAARIPEKELAQAAETGRAEDDRWLMLKNGERRFISGVSRAVRDEFGHVFGFLKVTRDVTSRWEAEEQLRQARDQLSRHAADLERVVGERTAHLEQSLASLEGILYHVAHDLRAPLRAMHGFTSLLLKEYGQHFDASGQEYARRVSEAAGRMDELICDLLEYGRLAHMPLPMHPVRLEEPLKRVLGDLGQEIKNQDANVDVQQPLPTVWANNHALEVVLSNLLTNALKFVAPQTRPKIRIHTQQNDGRVRIFVEDEGIGIDPKFQDRVFRVFERLHNTTQYPGTGIGLAIVHKAVERMGGDVGLHSTLGRGSTFWVELRTAAPPEHGPPLPSRPQG